MNKNKKICVLLAALIVVLGIVAGMLSIKGEALYNDAARLLGTTTAEAINYIKDPTLLKSVGYGQDPAELEAYLLKALGLEQSQTGKSDDEVRAIVKGRAVYAEQLALSKDNAAFTQFLKGVHPELGDEGLKAVIRNQEKSGPLREEMCKTAVMGELGLDEAGYSALVEDSDIVALFQEGLPFLMMDDEVRFYAVRDAIGWTTPELQRYVSDPVALKELPASLADQAALKDLLTKHLGYSADKADKALAEDPEGVKTLRSALGVLRSGSPFNLFNTSVMWRSLAIVLIVFGAAWLFILLRYIPSKRMARSKPMGKGAQRVTEFLLNYALYIILGAILIAVSFARPDFIKVNNIMQIMKQASTKGILALGCAGLIVLAGTDLSIGRLLGLSAAVCASLVQRVDYASRYYPQMTSQLPIIIPLLATIAVAVLFCMINGFGVAHLKMHAFIITLGTQLIAYGANCLYVEAQSAGSAQALATFDRNFINIAGGNLILGTWKIPYLVLLFLGVAVVMWVVWNKTRLGKNMFAVGGNSEAAAVSGVNVARTIMLVYLVAGILYGLASFLEASRLQSVGTNTGLTYETDAISACVIGGVSFSGGVGTIQGVVIGAIILQAINFSLNFLGVNPYLQYIVRGLIIVLAVAIDVRKYLVKK